MGHPSLDHTCPSTKIPQEICLKLLSNLTNEKSPKKQLQKSQKNRSKPNQRTFLDSDKSNTNTRNQIPLPLQPPLAAAQGEAARARGQRPGSPPNPPGAKGSAPAQRKAPPPTTQRRRGASEAAGEDLCPTHRLRGLGETGELRVGDKQRVCRFRKFSSRTHQRGCTLTKPHKSSNTINGPDFDR